MSVTAVALKSHEARQHLAEALYKFGLRSYTGMSALDHIRQAIYVLDEIVDAESAADAQSVEGVKE